MNSQGSNDPWLLWNAFNPGGVGQSAQTHQAPGAWGNPSRVGASLVVTGGHASPGYSRGTPPGLNAVPHAKGAACRSPGPPRERKRCGLSQPRATPGAPTPSSAVSKRRCEGENVAMVWTRCRRGRAPLQGFGTSVNLNPGRCPISVNLKLHISPACCKWVAWTNVRSPRIGKC